MKCRISVLLLVIAAFPLFSYAQYTVQQKEKNELDPNKVEQVGKLALTEGDILVSMINHQKKGAVVATTAGGRRWPNAILPFYIDDAMSPLVREHIYQAMIQISLQTRIRFREVDSAHLPKDYIVFVPSESTICASHVGRKGGGQEIILAPRCQKGSIMHEIFHALGFWHEQSRADRDNHILIRWENIKAEKQHNFSKHVDDGIDLAEYDYESIMHYGPKAFSNNGEDTIIPLVPGKVIGQRAQLSELDIKAMNDIYPCKEIDCKVG